MSVLGKYIKQPSETESYTIDYTDDLTADDGVVSATVAATDGITVTGYDVNLDSVRVWLTGGTAGMKYKIEVTATTGDGRVLQDEFFVTIKDY